MLSKLCWGVHEHLRHIPKDNCYSLVDDLVPVGLNLVLLNILELFSADDRPSASRSQIDRMEPLRRHAGFFLLVFLLKVDWWSTRAYKARCELAVIDRSGGGRKTREQISRPFEMHHDGQCRIFQSPINGKLYFGASPLGTTRPRWQQPVANYPSSFQCTSLGILGTARSQLDIYIIYQSIPLINSILLLYNKSNLLESLF